MDRFYGNFLQLTFCSSNSNIMGVLRKVPSGSCSTAICVCSVLFITGTAHHLSPLTSIKLLTLQQFPFTIDSTQLMHGGWRQVTSVHIPPTASLLHYGHSNNADLWPGKIASMDGVQFAKLNVIFWPPGRPASVHLGSSMYCIISNQ